MPFTLAHPAAAIPLRRLLGRYAVLSALIVGSMVPDLYYFTAYRWQYIDNHTLLTFLEYLTPFTFPTRIDSHSWLGLLVFCIPVGVLLYYYFEYVAKYYLAALLPSVVRARIIPGAMQPNTASVVAVIISIAVGATTHLVWDSFTHGHGLFVGHFEAFNTPVFELGGVSHKAYRILQHLSTIIGLGFLTYWFVRWHRNTAPSARVARPLWSTQIHLLIILLITTFASYQGIRVTLRHYPATAPTFNQIAESTGYFIFTAGGWWLSCIVVIAFAYRLYLHFPKSKIPSA